MNFDHNLFLTINGWAGNSHLLDSLFVFFADKFLYLSIVAVALLWFNKKLRNYVYLAGLSVIVGRGLVTEILKRIVHRPRPFQVLNVHQLIVDNEVGNSFPSGHAVAYFAIAFSFYGTKLFWPMIILASIGSFARVFVGVHYPVDVVMGMVIAGFTVAVIKPLYKRFYLDKKSSI